MDFVGLFSVLAAILPIILFIFLSKKQKIASIIINVIMLAILIFSYNYYVVPADRRHSYAGLFWIIYFLIPCISIDILIKVIMLIYSKLIVKQVIK